MEEKKYERKEAAKAFFTNAIGNMITGAVSEAVSVTIQALIGGQCCCAAENTTGFFGGNGKFFA